MKPIFTTRLRVLCILGPLYTAAAIALSAIAGCRACDVAGVFYFCSDEGPHEVIQNPPAEWRARCADVQEKLLTYTAENFPDSVSKFYHYDVDSLVFVRVLGHGIPNGAMRTAGDSIYMNADDVGNPGDMRHECVHWIQPNNGWLQRDDRGRRNIHYPPVFRAAIAPLIAYG